MRGAPLAWQPSEPFDTTDEGAMRPEFVFAGLLVALFSQRFVDRTI